MSETVGWLEEQCNGGAICPSRFGSPECGSSKTGFRETLNGYVLATVRRIEKSLALLQGFICLAPRPGFEPGTCGLTVRRSTG